MKEVYRKMMCVFCLFCMGVGLSTYWCDFKEEYTGEHSPVCDHFLPNEKAVAEYRRRIKKNETANQV